MVVRGAIVAIARVSGLAILGYKLKVKQINLMMKSSWLRKQFCRRRV
jgi:hypothetical protein